MKKYKRLAIASNTYDQYLKFEKKISYKKWVDYIELNSHYFSWLEDTEKGKRTLSNIQKYPENLKDKVLRQHRKHTAYASFNTKKGYYELKLSYLDDFGHITTTIQKQLTKNELLLLFEMAEFLDAYLIDSMTRIVSREEIENLETDRSKKINRNNTKTASRSPQNTYEKRIDNKTQAALSKTSVLYDLKNLSYFDYANDIDQAIDETFKGYSDDGIINFPYNVLGRIFYLDGEFIFEQDGLANQIESMTSLFKEMGLTVTIEDYKEVFTAERYLKRDIKINGMIYNGLPATDWGDASEACIRIINQILKANNKNEKVFLLFADETSTMILLTEEQFEYLDTLIPDESDEKPKRIC